MIDLIGQCLGQCEIIAPLAKGGMATVYRARQLNVEREVAIKVLKPELVENPDFIKRFEREAKIIASLSHPHILKLFDYGQQGDTIYLITELLTGGSLAELIEAGPLPLQATVYLFKQIGQALDYAHRRGIVHRDLKPPNVLLDEDGNVFLSDFGIATLLTDATERAQSGMVVGTPAYIAPEQWLGADVDARTDIYALGVILYEMLTGAPPFVADSTDALIHQHLNEMPPTLYTRNPALPLEMDHVIQKALAKDPADRFASALALIEAFDAALPAQELLDVTPLPQPSSPAIPQMTVQLDLPPREEKRRTPLVIGVALAALALIGLALVMLPRVGQAAPGGTRVAVIKTEDPVQPSPGMTGILRTATSSSTPAPTLTATRDTTAIAAMTSVGQLTSTANAVASYTKMPTLTPTSTLNLQATIAAGVAMTATSQAVLAMTIIAQTPAQTPAPTLAPPSATPSPSPFTDSGKIAFASDRDGNWEIYLMDNDGQNPHNLTQNRASDTLPVWSPDGKQILFISNRDGNEEIYLMNSDGQNLRNLTQNRATDAQPVWSPDGKQIAFVSYRDGNAEIYVMTTEGASQRLTDNKAEDSYSAWSPNGSEIAFVSKRNGNEEIFAVEVSTRKERRLTKDRSSNRFPTWSPDGSQIAFISNRGAKWDIFVIDADGKNERNLSDNASNDIEPLWSPNGKQIAFISDRRDDWEIWLMDRDGLNPDRLTSNKGTDTSPAWSSDGKQIIFSMRSSDGQFEIYVMDAYGKNQRRLTTNKADDTSPAWQPHS